MEEDISPLDVIQNAKEMLLLKGDDIVPVLECLIQWYLFFNL